LQNALITVFEFAIFRAVFDWVTRNGVQWAARSRAWAGKLVMSDTTSERVFVALCVVVITVLSFQGSGPAGQRAINASYQATSTLLTLVVLLRVGLFASAVMFFVNFLLLRMPLTFDGHALYAGGSWLTIVGILALAAAGLWMARGGESLIADR